MRPWIPILGLLCAVAAMVGCDDKDETSQTSSKPLTAEEYYNQGLGYVIKKNNKAAIQSFTKALGLNPDYAEARLQRGLAFMRGTMYALARKDLEKALALDPDGGIGKSAAQSLEGIEALEMKNAAP